jgi:hypothetical protein
MASSIHLEIKILDDNSVSRIFQDPDFEGMQMTFYRCLPLRDVLPPR